MTTSAACITRQSRTRILVDTHPLEVFECTTNAGLALAAIGPAGLRRPRCPWMGRKHKQSRPQWHRWRHHRCKQDNRGFQPLMPALLKPDPRKNRAITAEALAQFKWCRWLVSTWSPENAIRCRGSADRAPSTPALESGTWTDFRTVQRVGDGQLARMADHPTCQPLAPRGLLRQLASLWSDLASRSIHRLVDPDEPHPHRPSARPPAGRGRSSARIAAGASHPWTSAVVDYGGRRAVTSSGGLAEAPGQRARG